MAEMAAQLESGEFDVVFNAAHMLRWVELQSRFSDLRWLRC